MSVEVNQVTKLYGEQRALDGVSISIKEGEIVGFLGPNGAGKSTMMKIITGYIPPSSGAVKVCGLDVDKESMQIRSLIGYLPEHNPLYLEMYVKEFLSFTAEIYKIKNIKKRVEEVIEMVGLGLEQHKKIGALSKGYRQRVGLAQALIHDPKVLILDEPTSGLDPNQIVEIRNLIKEMGKRKTVMMSTHIMQEVEAICDRIIIINKGKIVANDKRGEIVKKDSEKQVIYVEFDLAISKDLISTIEHVDEVKAVDDKKWYIVSNGQMDIRNAIFQFAVQQKISVLTMKEEEKNLEDIFKKLTN